MHSTLLVLYLYLCNSGNDFVQTKSTAKGTTTPVVALILTCHSDPYPTLDDVLFLNTAQVMRGSQNSLLKRYELWSK